MVSCVSRASLALAGAFRKGLRPSLPARAAEVCSAPHILEISAREMARAPDGPRGCPFMSPYKKDLMSAICSVVIADDNCDAADTLVQILSGLGYRAVAVYHGQGAVDACALFGADLAI